MFVVEVSRPNIEQCHAHLCGIQTYLGIYLQPTGNNKHHPAVMQKLHTKYGLDEKPHQDQQIDNQTNFIVYYLNEL